VERKLLEEVGGEDVVESEEVGVLEAPEVIESVELLELLDVVVVFEALEVVVLAGTTRLLTISMPSLLEQHVALFSPQQ
jgi:hypothetical protein